MVKHCPICRNQTASISESSNNPYYPFCCERCRLIDLGHWFEETYRLEVQDIAEFDAEQSDASADPG